MEKFEFSSVPWIGELRRVVLAGLSDVDLAGIEFTLSQEFTNAPEHLLGGDAKTVGFHIRISSGQVEVGEHPLADADYQIIADYSSVLPGVRRQHGADPRGDAEDQREAAALLAAGKLEVRVRMERPDVLTRLDLHNQMAAKTA